MSKRDELIEKYAADLKQTCGMTPDMDLLIKVTKACGPAIYRDDAATVAVSDKDEMERVKKNFLVKRLGLTMGADLDKGLDAAIDKYGRSNRNKHRAVLYYLLVKQFGREKVFA